MYVYIYIYIYVCIEFELPKNFARPKIGGAYAPYAPL